MTMVFEHKTHVENSIEEAFAWHERKGAFRRLMPPWELAEEVRADDNLEEGSPVSYTHLTLPTICSV